MKLIAEVILIEFRGILVKGFYIHTEFYEYRLFVLPNGSCSTWIPYEVPNETQSITIELTDEEYNKFMNKCKER